jgi:hypothetical protein
VNIEPITLSLMKASKSARETPRFSAGTVISTIRPKDAGESTTVAPSSASASALPLLRL